MADYRKYTDHTKAITVTCITKFERSLTVVWSKNVTAYKVVACSASSLCSYLSSPRAENLLRAPLYLDKTLSSAFILIFIAMVVTRSHCPECKANGGGRHDPRDHNRGTDAAIHRDAARVAASHRTSTRSRGKKNSRALKPSTPTEGGHKRAHRRATVSHQDATRQYSGRKATREHALYLAPGQIRY